jgi:hypothetical protein
MRKENNLFFSWLYYSTGIFNSAGSGMNFLLDSRSRYVFGKIILQHLKNSCFVTVCFFLLLGLAPETVRCKKSVAFIFPPHFLLYAGSGIRDKI